jgi:3-polyprenyl-4-hydroxybenzoate decarboxylase
MHANATFMISGPMPSPGKIVNEYSFPAHTRNARAERVCGMRTDATLPRIADVVIEPRIVNPDAEGLVVIVIVVIIGLVVPPR